MWLPSQHLWSKTVAHGSCGVCNKRRMTALGASGSDMLHGSAQGAVGETYNRRLLGDAILNPEHPLYLADDFKFHGEEAEYLCESIFSEPS